MLCLSVCLLFGSVRLYPINVETAEPISSKFCVRPNLRFMNAQNYKNVCPEVFDFSKILKFARTNIIQSAIFLCYCFKKMGAKCPKSLVIIYIYMFRISTVLDIGFFYGFIDSYM